MRFRLMPGLPRRAARRLLASFLRAERGATAVEFGMVGLPFLSLIYAILEIAMVFWTTQALETAVANASRQIYTGQFQTSASNANLTSAQLLANFKTLLCSNATTLFDCSEVSVDIRSFSGFSGSSPPSATKTTGTTTTYDTSGFGYQNVGAKQIAIVTATLEYKTLMPMLVGTTGLTNGNRVIMATAAFRTEPY